MDWIKVNLGREQRQGFKFILLEITVRKSRETFLD